MIELWYIHYLWSKQFDMSTQLQSNNEYTELLIEEELDIVLKVFEK
jgi:hypothetical protein